MKPLPARTFSSCSWCMVAQSLRWPAIRSHHRGPPTAASQPRQGGLQGSVRGDRPAGGDDPVGDDLRAALGDASRPEVAPADATCDEELLALLPGPGLVGGVGPG